MCNDFAMPLPSFQCNLPWLSKSAANTERMAKGMAKGVEKGCQRTGTKANTMAKVKKKGMAKGMAEVWHGSMNVANT